MPTTSSWAPGWLTSARRVAASGQRPRGHTHLRRCSCGAPANLVGAGEMFKTLACLTVCSSSTRPPEQPGPGEGTRHLPSSACVPWQGAPEPERLRPGEGMERSPGRAQPWQGAPEPERLRPGEGMELRATWEVPLQSSLEPEQSIPVRRRHRGRGQSQRGPYTASTPRTPHAPASFPSHNTTEQVSLNK